MNKHEEGLKTILTLAYLQTLVPCYDTKQLGETLKTIVNIAAKALDREDIKIK